MNGPPGGSSAWAMYRALVGIGCVCALMIVTAFLLTRPVIAAKRTAAMHRAVFAVLPGTRSSVPLGRSTDGRWLRLAPGEPAPAYLGLDAEGRITGLAIAAAGMGYQDRIHLLYGYVPATSRIVGMQVLESRETPGLGDRIGHDAVFLAAFAALQIPLSADKSRVLHPVSTADTGHKRQPWQIDAITGATISSRAVADILAASTARWAPRIQRQMEALTRIGADAEGADAG